MEKKRLDLVEFEARFQTEKDCADYLFEVRWPYGFSCLRCGHHHAYIITSRRLPLFQCSSCHYQASLTVGTVMEGSRTELRKWFMAFFLISSPNGINGKQLEKNINVTYKTAYSMLQKIRHAMSEEDAINPLSGSVYVNQAHYNHIRGWKSLDSHKENSLIIGASMNGKNGPDYVKLKLVDKEFVQITGHIGYVLQEGKEDFCENHVEPNTSKVEFEKLYDFAKQKKLFRLKNELIRWIP